MVTMHIYIQRWKKKSWTLQALTKNRHEQVLVRVASHAYLCEASARRNVTTYSSSRGKL